MKILLVTSRYPWPSRRGDQLRAVQHLEFLGPEHEVTLLTPEPEAGAPAPPAGVRVETYRRPDVFDRLTGAARCLRRGLPLQNALFHSRDLSRRLRHLEPKADAVLVQLVRLADQVEQLGEAPLIVDFIDSLALNFRQWARVEGGLKGRFLAFEARRLDTWERRLLRRAELSLTVSDRDRRAMLESIAGAGEADGRVDAALVTPPLVTPPLVTLPLAFPLAALEGAPDEVADPRQGPDRGELGEASAPLLAMTGNLGYFVTVDGFCWWLEEVWPLLHRRRPDVRVVVAGARPAQRLREAARQAGIRLLSSPPDLKAILRTADLAIAPMRCGAGQPLKILEAWECGVPVVASPWAAAGTTASAGRDLALAATPEEWVEEICALLDSAELRRERAAAARQCLEADYGRPALRRRIQGLLEERFTVSRG